MAARTHRYELLHLPGLQEIVADEVRARLGVSPEPVPGRDDSLDLTFAGAWRRLLRLRTAVAAYAYLHFPVPRPRALLSGEHLPHITDALTRVAARQHRGTAHAFRFEAAGADSQVFTRLGQALSDATGLRHDQQHGDLVLRVRPAVGHGWDVLVRLSARPLSARPWRVRDVPGAVNATIAAAMVRLTDPRPDDRVVNVMCGSGTLLAERLLAAPTATALGVDADPDVQAACAANLAAADVRDRVQLRTAALTDPEWRARGPFDVLLADPPWGALVGSHRDNEALHRSLLETAHAAAAPGARCAVLTHEIRRMERSLRRCADLWEVDQVRRVFQKGHHPRMYLLTPR